MLSGAISAKCIPKSNYPKTNENNQEFSQFSRGIGSCPHAKNALNNRQIKNISTATSS